MHAGKKDEIDIIPRSVYLKGIKSKTFGGGDKVLKIKQVFVKGKVATAYFTQKGKAFGFHNFVDFIKLKGSWKLVSSTTHMEFY